MNPREDLIKEDLQEKPRIPDVHTKHNINYDPKTYISIQERVNSDLDYEKMYIDKLINDGWAKLQNNESILEPELKGQHFKYRLNGKSLSEAEKGTFRSGGFIIGMKDNDRKYILYKAYNGSIFPVQIKDLDEIYIKDPEKEIIKVTRPTKVTNYPVFIRVNNIPTIIYYGNGEADRQKFMDGNKYNKILNGIRWTFVDPIPRKPKIITDIKFNRPTQRTRYPVYLTHPKTKKDVVVYYARDNTQRDRFTFSEKFKKAFETGQWSFK